MAARNVTVFGGSGFLGRYIVRLLAAQGYRVRIACRDPERGAFLKPMGDVGQIALVQANIRNEASVVRAIAGADIVINLVGIMYQRGKQRFTAVQADGAGTIARAAAAAGVARLIHVSAMGAATAVTCEYAQAKVAGEAQVLAAFPQATILRPSVVFGPEDKFFNLFASLARFLPVMPAFGDGSVKLQPVYVGDVAAATLKVIEDAASQAQIYELGGPRVLNFKETMQLTCDTIGRKRLVLPFPFFLAKFDAAFLQLMPRPLLTMDQVEALKYDNVANPELPGLADLGITPEPMESVLASYLYRYRRAGKLTESRFG
jgi:uncharacterized protein YbjT (DUF2867 family)